MSATNNRNSKSMIEELKIDAQLFECVEKILHWTIIKSVVSYGIAIYGAAHKLNLEILNVTLTRIVKIIMKGSKSPNIQARDEVMTEV